jgi:hypothetical protein
VIHRFVKTRCAQPGLEEKDVSDFVQEEGRDVHLEWPGFDLDEERARFL